MIMRLEQLQCLLDVAQTGSLTSTAKRLFVSQQAVSKSIKQLEEELGVRIVIYNKQFKNEKGVAQKFYPDNIIAMLPNGTLGRTWYGTTPEESRGAQAGASVSVVNTGVAITVTTTTDPVNTKTTASEIVLPSFERAEDCFFIEVA